MCLLYLFDWKFVSKYINQMIASVLCIVCLFVRNISYTTIFLIYICFFSQYFKQAFYMVVNIIDCYFVDWIYLHEHLHFKMILLNKNVLKTNMFFSEFKLVSNYLTFDTNTGVIKGISSKMISPFRPSPWKVDLKWVTYVWLCWMNNFRSHPFIF